MTNVGEYFISTLVTLGDTKMSEQVTQDILALLESQIKDFVNRDVWDPVWDPIWDLFYDHNREKKK